MLGNVKQTSGVKGVGDLVGKMFGAKASNESVIKPVYSGTGLLMLEPTYKHLITVDVSEWGTIVLDDGLFYACDGTVRQQSKARRNISSAILGSEGLFNLSLSGNGYAILESPVPAEELIRIDLDDDEIKIDGNFAIAWSDGLDFRTETISKNILTSAASKEGFVNVYRGTGSILLAPVLPPVKVSQLSA